MSARPAEFASLVNEMPCAIGLLALKKIGGLSQLEQREALNELGKKTLLELDAIEKLCISEISSLLHELSPSTVTSSISTYRNVLKEVNPESPALYYFKMRHGFYSKRSKNYAISVKEKSRNLREFHNESDYLKRAIALMSTKSYINIAMGLCAATGRRPSEILLTAKFKKIDGHTMLFSGQLKTKESDSARDNYEIPVLAHADLIIDALERLRGLRDFSNIEVKRGQTTAQALSKKTAKSQGECVKRYFSDFIPPHEKANGDIEQITPYCLRQVYVLIATQHFCPSSTESAVYASDILGHLPSDIATAHSYKVFKYAGANDE